MNRVATAIQSMQPRVAALEPDKLEVLDKSMDVEFDEHFAYQEMQARAHASGKLSPDEAMVIYRALGMVGSTENGGWASGTDLATKVIVTKIMGELIGA